MPSVWTVSTTGQAAACPEGLRATRTASSRTKSTFSSSSRPSVAAGRACRPRRASRPPRRPGPATAHALAVVPAARGLGHDRPADLVAEARDLRRRRAPAPSAGRAMPERGEPLAHGQLVLGEAQGRRARVQGDAVGLERLEHVRRDVLVVEGDDVAAARERAAPPRGRCGRPTGADGTTSAARGVRRLGEHATAGRPARRPGPASSGPAARRRRRRRRGNRQGGAARVGVLASRTRA